MCKWSILILPKDQSLILVYVILNFQLKRYPNINRGQSKNKQESEPINELDTNENLIGKKSLKNFKVLFQGLAAALWDPIPQAPLPASGSSIDFPFGN